jgi:monofunctional biosynthetic peptidoglycan transglycosylase
MRHERGMARKLMRPIRVLVLVLAAVPLLGAGDVALTWWRYRRPIAALAADVPRETAYMRQRAEAGLPAGPRVWTPLDDIGTVAVCAVVAAEDYHFFEHGTLDWEAQRGIIRNLLRGDLSFGGSTIAQQLARNLFLGPDRTPRRKVREYVLAYALSHALSKTRQLELYLNLVEWGPGVWGIGAASRHWFGKPPASLTPSEAVLLAAVLPAPLLGLRHAATPAARRSQGHAVDRLWAAALLDGVEREATAARLERWASYVKAGYSSGDALAIVERELGPEAPAEQWGTGTGPAAHRCDQRWGRRA